MQIVTGYMFRTVLLKSDPVKENIKCFHPRLKSNVFWIWENLKPTLINTGWHFVSEEDFMENSEGRVLKRLVVSTGKDICETTLEKIPLYVPDDDLTHVADLFDLDPKDLLV